MKRLAPVLLLALAGCAATPEPRPFRDVGPPPLPLPDPIPAPRFSKADPIVVLTPEITAELNRAVDAGAEPYAFFALTPDDYLALARFQTDLAARLEHWRLIACHDRELEPACRRPNPATPPAALEGTP